MSDLQAADISTIKGYKSIGNVKNIAIALLAPFSGSKTTVYTQGAIQQTAIIYTCLGNALATFGNKNGGKVLGPFTLPFSL